ncbi:MAG TPA: hypothetical protein PKZ97_09425, partial [Azospirillaceae bacterium]|nr:hypothetical protein [Azospirillaceae bacterium]HRQ81326.1 hypothetical protein [Azospirillaceae bacterium]
RPAAFNPRRKTENANACIPAARLIAPTATKHACMTEWFCAILATWSGGRIGRLPRHNEGDKKLPEKLLTLLVLILEIIKLLLEHFLGQ